jgi:hypothetical protein
MQIEKILISYSYSHQNSSSGKRLKILNKNFLMAAGWKIITSLLSKTEEPNTEQIPTLVDKNFKPISYSNTTSRRSIKSLLLKILWPDKGIFWAIKTNLRLIKRVFKSQSHYRIVTVSYPFSSHLVGASLKSLFPKRVYFIAHFMDGFYLINKGNGAPAFLAPLSYFAEYFVNRMADRIIINNSKYDEFSKIFHPFINKCQSVDELPGLFLPMFQSQANGTGRCLFAGSLYKKIRNPDKVIELFEKLPHFRLKIAGNLNDCTDVLNAKHIEYLGLLSQLEIIDELEKADYLINIDNQDMGQQPPGKIIEYMQLQKPIINFYIKQSISGPTLKKFSISPKSYLEVDLMDDASVSIEKIKSFKPSSSQLFSVPNNYENIYRLYSEES